jgi:hypothetical protein
MILASESIRLDGKTTLVGIRPGHVFVVAVPSSAKFVPTYQETVIPANGEVHVNLTLEAGIALEGIVQDITGKGVPRVEVEAEIPLSYRVDGRHREKLREGDVVSGSGAAGAVSNNIRGLVLSWSFDPALGTVSRKVTADSDGKFVLEGIRSATAVKLVVHYGDGKTYEQWVLGGTPARIILPPH